MANSAADAYREAEERIATALRTQSDDLSLRSDEIGRLTDVPMSLVRLTGLRRLDLTGHKLRNTAELAR